MDLRAAENRVPPANRTAGAKPPSRTADRAPTRWTRIRKAASLVLFVLLVGIVALEVQLRVLRVPASVTGVFKDFHRADARLGWRGRPNVRLRFHERSFDVVIEQGDDGFRRPEPAPPPAASRRILFLGDSLLWGWGVAQGELLTDVLQRDLAPDVAIYNRAVSSYGTAQELLLLEDLLDEGSYDAVVLIFSRTDPGDNTEKMRRRPAFALVDGRLAQVSSPPEKDLREPVKRFLGITAVPTVSSTTSWRASSAGSAGARTRRVPECTTPGRVARWERPRSIRGASQATTSRESCCAR